MSFVERRRMMNALIVRKEAIRDAIESLRSLVILFGVSDARRVRAQIDAENFGEDYDDDEEKLLESVAAYAVGGRELLRQRIAASPGARLLLGHMSG